MRDTKANRENVERLYQWFRNRGVAGVSSRDAAEFLCCSQSHAANLIGRLVKDGRVVWTGRKKDTDGRGKCKTYRATETTMYPPPSCAAT